MATIVKKLTDLVGNTPLLELSGYNSAHCLEATILGKLEYFNPTGSLKDRTALAMIEDAEQKGLLKEGSVIVEPTSGNTGIGLAFVAASRGYRLIITLPESFSIERRNLLKALGAELVLTPAKLGMKGAVDEAARIVRNTLHAYSPQQFNNPANPAIHKRTTAEEIWRDTNGKIDIFVAGVGTGGTISGVAEVLKAYNPHIQIVAVEPAESPLLSGGQPGPHKIQGIGPNFIPQNLNRTVIDEILVVKSDDAIRTSRELASREGLLVGASSGAAVFAARLLALRPANKAKTIVAILPDTGERYLTTSLYAFDEYPL